MFMKIWGAGEHTAIQWYGLGCRSLDDVSKVPNLTAMQKVGIK